MEWVVDTSVLVDVFENDPDFGLRSARCLTRYLSQGLVVCPVTYIEFSPVCLGDQLLQETFFRKVGVRSLEPWTSKDTLTAHCLWNEHIQAKRAGSVKKRPIADVFIGAFALRYAGLITRNAKDFSRLAPGLSIVEP
ncbi:MAG: type II toxin-antitoxin system VapC family toxin [Opitutales bacterium]